MRCSRVMYENITNFIFLSLYTVDKVNSIPGIGFVATLPARSDDTKPGFLPNPGKFILHETSSSAVVVAVLLFPFLSQPIYLPLLHASKKTFLRVLLMS